MAKHASNWQATQTETAKYVRVFILEDTMLFLKNLTSTFTYHKPKTFSKLRKPKVKKSVIVLENNWWKNYKYIFNREARKFRGGLVRNLELLKGR
jgi:hypothetical protein